MTTFTITLDDLDLALLPMRTHSYNNFLNKEYFHYEVLKTETVAERNKAIEEPVPTIVYKCHLCAIEVPAAFASEHAESKKHRANARIASVAVQRTHALISAPPPPLAAKESARFCANCTAIVDEEHDNTKEHRVAAMYDNLLWDLMTTYVGDDDESNEHTLWNNDKSEAKSKIDDYEKDLDNDNKYNNSIANAKIASAGNKKGIKNRIENKKTKNEPFAIITNTKLEEHNKNEEVTKYDTRKNSTTITEEIQYNSPMNEHILPTTSLRNGSMTNMENQITQPCVSTGPNDPGNKVTSKAENTKHSTIHDDKTADNQATNLSGLPKIRPRPLALESIIDLKCRINSADQKEQTSLVTNEIGAGDSAKHDNDTILARRFANTNIRFELKETNNKIQIRINDDVLNVYSDHFHSYDRKINNEIECIVCDCILNNADAKVHKYDLEHMTKIANIGNDDHYVREINDSYSHCILCNQKISNARVALHKEYARNHISRKALMTKSNTDKPKPNVEAAERKDEEIQHKTPTVNEENAIIETAVISKSNDIVVSQIEYPYEKISETIVKCVVCNRNIPSDLLNSHNKGSKHIKKTMKKMGME